MPATHEKNQTSTPSPVTPTGHHLSRTMSLLTVTMIGVGAMIGAGIFVLTGLAAEAVGPGRSGPASSWPSPSTVWPR